MDYPTLFLCLLQPGFRNLPLGKMGRHREPNSDLAIKSARQETSCGLGPPKEGLLPQTARMGDCGPRVNSETYVICHNTLSTNSYLPSEGANPIKLYQP